MINLPNPPTDNLYKFISIFGLVVCILSVYFVEIKSSELTNEIIAINGEYEKLELERQKLESKRTELKKRIEIYHENNGIDEKPVFNDSLIVWTKIIAGTKSSVQESSEITELLSSLTEVRVEFDKKEIELENKNEILDLKISQEEKVMEWIDIFLPIGILLTFIGFLLWYSKSQFYQDKVLKKQFDSSKKKSYCQSCGIPLSRDKAYNSLTIDEQEKTIYCSHCYQNNEFVQPELTIEQMKKQISIRCKELGLSKLHTYFFTKDLDQLERWRKKFEWKEE